MSDLTLDGLLRRARMTRRLGPFAGVLRYFPGHVPLERDGRSLRRIEAVISSLSSEERRNPQSISEGRVREIAGRNGMTEEDTRKFFRQFGVMRDLLGA